MAQKRKNDGELANSKKQKTRGKANLIFSAAAAVLSPMVSLVTNNKVFIKLLGKKTPSIHDPVTVQIFDQELEKVQIFDQESEKVQIFDQESEKVTLHFPEEILVDILSRLPVRSLVRFKCVSKFWTTLISHPYFIRKHLNRAKNDQHSQKLLINRFCTVEGMYGIHSCPLSLVQRFQDPRKLRLDCPSIPKPTRCVIHCCYDGLAIIEVCDSNRVLFLLWNPAIRESILLPALGCPLDGVSRFGLGYDSSSGGYKILHMHQSAVGSKYTNEILALKGGSWRSIDEHPHGKRRCIYAMEYFPFIHAAFHWIAFSRNSFVVVSFSISNEVYGEVPLSEEILSLRSGSAKIGLSVLDGMLSFHSNSKGEGTFKVWVLKEYGVKGSWMPLLTIVKETSFFSVLPIYRFADGEVLFRCVNVVARGVAFRTVNGPFKPWPLSYTMQGGQAFTESLISPKSLTY